MTTFALSGPVDYRKEALARDIQDLFIHLERLEASRNALLFIFHNLEEMAIGLVSHSRLEVLFMLKNKLGLTKEQAKNIYFRFRNGGGEEEGSPEPAKEPETNEEKIAMIMDYMKDTSAKLDQIENDIAYLKKQVDQILKRL